jgi:pimeloyl-ACP methyl ester carboxylesterase
MLSSLSVARLVTKGFAEVNDTSLYYEIVGRGHPLVLVHGFSLNTKMWDDQFGVFAKRFKVIRYDVRGFGKSALPTVEKEYSHTGDLKALLNQLEIDYVYVVGLSMGGYIALDFALEYPESTKALILVDSTLGGFRAWSKTDLKLYELIWKEAKEKSVETAKDMWRNYALFKPAFEKPDVAFRLAQMIFDYSGWHFVNADPLRSLDPPAIERLQEIKVPTLIVVGERDLPDLHRIADILNMKIRHSQRITLKGAGHMSNMETPREFNEAVLSFLANI